MSTAEQRAGALGRVLELVLMLNDDMTRSLARDGLTPSRAPVLWELGQRGPCTQRELAEALHVSPRTMTGLIDGLAATGFVTREPHPTDRRATHVTFTERGSRLVAKLQREQGEFADLLFADLPDRRLAAFVSGLDHVLARLREHGLEVPRGDG